ncbi:MAG: helix-turn-helix transcriptional regulator [Clostridia bacterium]|nr:helix-turn-helix transcriptional regulator [Clostridia bacterium]
MEIKIFSVAEYQPKIRKKTITSRVSSTFLYIENGEYIYQFKNNEFKVCSGETLFLPRGSNYEYEVVSENAHCFQVEFNIKSLENEFEFNKPFVINAQNSEKIENLFSSLLTNFRNSQQGLIKCYAIVLDLLTLVDNQNEKVKSKIHPAIEYIEQNYTLDFSISHLARLCKISESQLRRLFQSELGVSPLKYRNSLRIKEACALLKSGELNVSEVSEILKFDTPYAFSKAFKNELGCSPKSFQMNFK